ncbi:VWA domain-containing protein [Azospirillum sp. sgz302134]
MKEALNVLGGKVRNAAASVLHSLHVVAGVIGRKTGVQIVVGGTEAKTDSRSVHIPALDLLNQAWRAIAYGYLIHESFHLRYTDFSVYAEVGSQPMRKHLLNVIEDPVIEHRGIQEFPGVRQDLNEVVREMIRDGGFAAPAGDEHPGAVLCNYVLYKLRHDVTGQTQLGEILRETEKQLRATFPPGAVLRLGILLKDAEECFTTRDCLDLADDILVMLKEEEEKARQPDPSPPPQDQDSGQGQGRGSSTGNGQDQSDGQGQGNGQDQSNAQGQSSSGHDGNGQAGQPDQSGTGNGQNQDGQGQDQGGAPGNAPGNAASGQGQGSQPSSGVRPSNGQGSGAGSGGDGKRDQAKADAITQALNATNSVLPTDTFGDIAKRLTAAARSKDPNAVPIPTLPGVWPAPENAAFGQKRLEKVRATSSRIRSQMQGLVQASRQSPARRARVGQVIDGSRLALVATGEDRVFLKRDEVRAPNTAFHLLIDQSGSMADPGAGGSQLIDVACEASLALALALEGVPGVSVAVSSFPGVLTVLKRGESVRAAAGRFTLKATGGTPMAPAIWHAVTEIAQAPEERKVIMVLTDGAPDNRPAVEHVVQRCIASGVEVIGIGIGTGVVKTLFPVSAVIHDVEQLRDVMFNLARRALLASKAA